MIYAVKFVYNDGKDLLCNVAEENIGLFFANINQKQVFYDEKNNVGFWTDISTVRYIELRKIEDKGDQNAKPEAEAGSNAIPIDQGIPESPAV
jgi:hypothetical protein